MNNKNNKNITSNLKIKKYSIYALIGLASGILNGLFGAGGGCVLVPAMEKFLNTKEKESHATAVGAVLLLSVSSFIFYLKNGQFDTKLWFLTALGGLLGGITGAVFLNKISIKTLKIVFGAIIITTALKMIF